MAGYIGKSQSGVLTSVGTNTVESQDIIDGAVTTDKIATGAVTSAKLADTYQTPLVAGTDYLAPDGDGSGLTGIASDKITKSIAIATGGSITAGRAASITTSGEVGSYPVANTIVEQDSISDASAERVAVSIDGTTGCVIYGTNSGSTATFYIKGLALNGSTITESNYTSVSLSISGHIYSFSDHSFIEPITGNTFLWVYGCGGWDGASQSNSNEFQGRARVVTVNTSTGAVTLGSQYTVSSFVSGNWGSGSSMNLSRVQGSSKFFWVHSYSGSSQYHFIAVSGTTLTITREDDIGSFGERQTGGTDQNVALLTADNKFVVMRGKYYRVADYSNYALTNIGTAVNIQPDVNNDNYGFWYVLSSTRVVLIYLTAAADVKLDSYSVTSSTGALTFVDSVTLAANTLVWNETQVYAKDATSICFSYQKDGNTYFNTMSFDASGNIIGIGLPEATNTSSDISTRGNYTGSDTFVFLVNDQANDTVDYVTVDVSNYVTDSFNFIGFSQTTGTSGNADITVGGVVSGLTGLNTGSKYYIDSALQGTITTTNTTGILVGTAISSTELVLFAGAS